MNNLGQELALGIRHAPVQHTQGPWDTHLLRAALLAGIWITFFTGAVRGEALAARFAIWTLLLPTLILVVFALLDRTAISNV